MSDRNSDRTPVQFGKNPGCWPQKCLVRGLSLSLSWAGLRCMGRVSGSCVCARCTARVGRAQRFVFRFLNELEIVF